MINRSTDGKQRVLSLSYGKDSLACLGAIEQLVKERDAAIDELRREPDNCQWCRWWKPKSGFVRTCVSPEPCCVDGNPDRWKWRGASE